MKPICCQGALPSSYGTFHGLCWWATITLLFPPLLAIPFLYKMAMPPRSAPFSLICLSSANFGCIPTSSDTFSAGAENRYAEVNVGLFLKFFGLPIIVFYNFVLAFNLIFNFMNALIHPMFSVIPYTLGEGYLLFVRVSFSCLARRFPRTVSQL